MVDNDKLVRLKVIKGRTCIYCTVATYVRFPPDIKVMIIESPMVSWAHENAIAGFVMNRFGVLRNVPQAFHKGPL